MNFRNLEYFLAVAEEKNITRAAKKMYISQQSLSEHITKLEYELGVPLFERTPALRLTYAGERLELIAKRICSLEREILLEAGEIRTQQRGRLRLGISYTCGRTVLPLILPDFHKTHPLVEFSLMEGNHQQLNDWLDEGKIDLLIGYLPIDVLGADVSALLKERLLLVCPSSLTGSVFSSSAPHMREKFKKELDIHAFQDKPFILLKKGNRIRAMLDAYFARMNFVPDIILETENIETAFALAEKGVGITVYPELFLNSLHTLSYTEDSSLDFFPLSGKETLGTLGIALMDNSYHSPAVLDFVALCRQRLALWEPLRI